MSKNKTIQKAKNLKEDFLKDKDNRLVADLYKLYCMERNTEIDEARIKGREDGKKIGEIIGRKEGIIKVALNMLKQNMDIEIISKVTGLSLEDIKNINK